MKITDAKVFVCCPGRNFVTLKITTDEGLYGLGDATLNGRELPVASYLSDHVVPCLIGRDPFQTEDMWQYLYRGAYWRRGPVTMTAIAAVDMACGTSRAKRSRLRFTTCSEDNAELGCWYTGTPTGATSKRLRTRSRNTKRWDIWRCAPKREFLGCPRPMESRRKTALRARREGLAARERVVERKVSCACSQIVRGAAPEVWRRPSSPPRCASPSDSHRSRAPGQEPGAISPFLVGGPSDRGTAGGLSLDPPAHDHATGGWRSFQFRLGCSHSDHEQLIDYLRMTVVHGGRLTHLRKSPPWPRSITSAPAATVRPIFLRWRWRRRCTSIFP